MGDQVEKELAAGVTIRMAGGKLDELGPSWSDKIWLGQGMD